jgi:hypothetical protein
MGVTGERARALVSQMSSLASLSSEQRQELLSLISNIERVMHADRARGREGTTPSGKGESDAAAAVDDDMRDVVGVLSGASAKRRLGGDNYHDDGDADQSTVKDMYQRLIELQRKGRKASSDGGGRARRYTIDGSPPTLTEASVTTETRKNCHVVCASLCLLLLLFFFYRLINRAMQSIGNIVWT